MSGWQRTDDPTLSAGTAVRSRAPESAGSLRRWHGLRLQTAVARVSHRRGAARYTRRIIVSPAKHLPKESNVTTKPTGRRTFRVFIAIVAAAVIVASSSIVFAGSLSDPNYKEGFGKDATGGAGQPICLVTVSSGTGPGTLEACFQPGNLAANKQIHFTVSTVTPYFTRYIGSNVTIDGCANGMNGVTIDAPATDKRSLVLEDPATNVIIRCLNFRSTGTPNSSGVEFDLLSLDGTNGGSISNVFVDRCTFMQASDGALDITGNVANITVQRSLFYGNAITQLIKYGTRQNLSLHHNVYVHNGERNPQIKGDVRLLDFVNNVIYINSGDVTNYTDSSPTDPYGLRIWNAGGNSDSPGNITINVTASAHIGNKGNIELITDSGASAAGVYIGQNLCAPTSNCPASPRAIPNTVPAAYAVTTLATESLKQEMLPFVGAPNRKTLDQQRLDEVAAVLPGSVTPRPNTAPAAPSNLTIR
jgi:pectate lyase